MPYRLLFIKPLCSGAPHTKSRGNVPLATLEGSLPSVRLSLQSLLVKVVLAIGTQITALVQWRPIKPALFVMALRDHPKNGVSGKKKQECWNGGIQ